MRAFRVGYVITSVRPSKRADEVVAAGDGIWHRFPAETKPQVGQYAEVCQTLRGYRRWYLDWQCVASRQPTRRKHATDTD